jgi:isoleucyl-tRNA synthetase
VLTKLLAPILVFTAEEAWGHLGGGGSVHLQEFPAAESARRDGSTERAVEQLLKLRAVIGQAIEQARQDKVIGNALEAAVVLRGDTSSIRNMPKEDLEEFFILSDLTLEQAETTSAAITKTSYAKCARCWRHRPSVGRSAAHPDLCDRCDEVVTQLTARTAAE